MAQVSKYIYQIGKWRVKLVLFSNGKCQVRTFYECDLRREWGLIIPRKPEKLIGRAIQYVNKKHAEETQLNEEIKELKLVAEKIKKLISEEIKPNKGGKDDCGTKEKKSS